MLETRRADFSSRHSRVIAAAPAACYECIRRVDLGRSPVVRALLAARGLGRLRTVDALVGAGFVVVEDEPPLSLAFALIGKPWLPGGAVRRLGPREAVAFAEPGFVKVLWRFRVEPAGPDVVVTTTTEVWATDGIARRRFGLYWRVVGPFSGLLRRSMLRSVAECATG